MLKSMLSQLSNTLELVGIVNPYKKVYQLTKPLDNMSLFMMTLTLHTLEQLKFDEKLSTLRKSETKAGSQKNEVPIDGPHFIVGLITIFKQFNPEYFKCYIHHLAHYIKSIVHVSFGKPLPMETGTVLTYLDELVKFDGENREVVTQALGGFVFDCYNM